jgi:hypothetical protein
MPQPRGQTQSTWPQGRPALPHPKQYSVQPEEKYLEYPAPQRTVILPPLSEMSSPGWADFSGRLNPPPPPIPATNLMTVNLESKPDPEFYPEHLLQHAGAISTASYTSSTGSFTRAPSYAASTGSLTLVDTDGTPTPPCAPCIPSPPSSRRGGSSIAYSRGSSSEPTTTKRQRTSDRKSSKKRTAKQKEDKKVTERKSRKVLTQHTKTEQDEMMAFGWKWYGTLNAENRKQNNLVTKKHEINEDFMDRYRFLANPRRAVHLQVARWKDEMERSRAGEDVEVLKKVHWKRRARAILVALRAMQASRRLKYLAELKICRFHARINELLTLVTQRDEQLKQRDRRIEQLTQLFIHAGIQIPASSYARSKKL